ncbi:MAG: hypothetical protein QM765_30370 [Myxococcales bacterium]
MNQKERVPKSEESYSTLMSSDATYRTSCPFWLIAKPKRTSLPLQPLTVIFLTSIRTAGCPSNSESQTKSMRPALELELPELRGPVVPMVSLPIPVPISVVVLLGLLELVESAAERLRHRARASVVGLVGHVAQGTARRAVALVAGCVAQILELLADVLHVAEELAAGLVVVLGGIDRLGQVGAGLLGGGLRTQGSNESQQRDHRE